ncbi:hypothetical protein ACFWIZ_52330, partial [Streptomyces sp. NPDC127044]
MSGPFSSPFPSLSSSPSPLSRRGFLAATGALSLAATLCASGGLGGAGRGCGAQPRGAPDEHTALI